MCKLPGNACGNVFVKGYITDVIVTNSTPLAIYFYDEPGYELTITEDNPDIDLFFQAAVIADGPNAGNVVTFPFQLLPGQSANLSSTPARTATPRTKRSPSRSPCPWGHNANPLDDDETVNGEHVPISTTKFFPDTPPEQNPLRRRRPLLTGPHSTSVS